MNPVVTVIISAYNRSTLLGRAMGSVLGQTYQDFELIVVNDASNDNTEEVACNFKDERIRYVRHEENKGGPAARNTGIKLAQGKYIAFLDDDEWYAKKLEKQMVKIQTVQDNVGVIDCGFEQVCDGKFFGVQHIPEFRGDLRKELLKGSVIGSVSKPLIKAACFSKVRLFDEELTLGISVLEAMAMGKPIVATNDAAIPEIVEDGREGFLVAPGDRTGLSRGKVLTNNTIIF